MDDTLYYCNDANMNVTAVVDASDGDVVERYAYDPYGQVTVLNGEDDADGGGVSDWSADADKESDWDNRVLYCGYRLDPETGANGQGIHHVRNRHYEPPLGRWTSRDPLNQDVAGGGYHDGMGFYEYVRGAPVGGLDWLGLATLDVMENDAGEKWKEGCRIKIDPWWHRGKDYWPGELSEWRRERFDWMVKTWYSDELIPYRSIQSWLDTDGYHNEVNFKHWVQCQRPNRRAKGKPRLTKMKRRVAYKKWNFVTTYRELAWDVAMVTPIKIGIAGPTTTGGFDSATLFTLYKKGWRTPRWRHVDQGLWTDRGWNPEKKKYGCRFRVRCEVDCLEGKGDAQVMWHETWTPKVWNPDPKLKHWFGKRAYVYGYLVMEGIGNNVICQPYGDWSAWEEALCGDGNEECKVALDKE